MRITLSLICLLVLNSIQAQYGKEEAMQDLDNLKNGMLLVRLKTNVEAISQLEAQGKATEAEALRQRQYQKNRDIILSFSKSFDFCPVYFFYASQSEDIRNAKLSGNLFDSNLKLVETQKLPEFYLTAEFSKTENLGLEGLIIMNSKLFPMESPFPFYQRKYRFFGLVSHTKSKMVYLMNHNMHEHYAFWFPEKVEKK